MSLKTIEQWAEEKKTPEWLLEAAKAMHKWAQGKELEEAQYDKALEEAGKAGGGDGNPLEAKDPDDEVTNPGIATMDPQELPRG